MEQIVRVHGLLHSIGVCPSPLLEVITASGETFVGQLLRDIVGNTQSAKGWSCHGSITLTTERGKVEIDYLDVVTVQKTLSLVLEKSLLTVFPKKPHPSKTKPRPSKKKRPKSY